MDRAGAGRCVAGSKNYFVVLTLSPSGQFDERADRIAIAADSLQPELKPVIGARTVVDPDFGWRAERTDRYIEALH
jgi:hypothetical protein